MEELYKLIEKTIKEAGYQKPINGEDIYNEINDEIETKENGHYVFMSKREDTIFFEYHIEIMEDSFNLTKIIIHMPNHNIEVDFDN